MSSTPSQYLRKGRYVIILANKVSNQSLVVQSNFMYLTNLALKIDEDNKDKDKKINIDFLEPEFFSFDIKPEDSVEENPGFFHKLINAFDDNLKNAFDLTKIITDKDDMILSFSKKFAHYLTINGVTLSISRKGEEAITIGKEAKPTLSKLLTRSDDVQIKSTVEAPKLTDDVLTEE